MTEQPRRAIEWDAIVEGEDATVEQWQKVTSRWHPVNRVLTRILASQPFAERSKALEGLADLDMSGDEEWAQFVLNLTALSDAALGRINLAIVNNEKAGIYPPRD